MQSGGCRWPEDLLILAKILFFVPLTHLITWEAPPRMEPPQRALILPLFHLKSPPRCIYREAFWAKFALSSGSNYQWTASRLDINRRSLLTKHILSLRQYINANRWVKYAINHGRLSTAGHRRPIDRYEKIMKDDFLDRSNFIFFFEPKII